MIGSCQGLRQVACEFRIPGPGNEVQALGDAEGPVVSQKLIDKGKWVGYRLQLNRRKKTAQEKGIQA